MQKEDSHTAIQKYLGMLNDLKHLTDVDGGTTIATAKFTKQYGVRDVLFNILTNDLNMLAKHKVKGGHSYRWIYSNGSLDLTIAAEVYKAVKAFRFPSETAEGRENKKVNKPASKPASITKPIEVKVLAPVFTPAHLELVGNITFPQLTRVNINDHVQLFDITRLDFLVKASKVIIKAAVVKGNEVEVVYTGEFDNKNFVLKPNAKLYPQTPYTIQSVDL